MSRLRVKALLDNSPHTLEVDRKSITFNQLLSDISSKLNLTGFTINFQSSNGIQYQISDDSVLQKAIQESTKAGCRSFDVKIIKGGRGSISSSNINNNNNNNINNNNKTSSTPPPPQQPQQQPQQQQQQPPPQPQQQKQEETKQTPISQKTSNSTYTPPPKNFNTPTSPKSTPTNPTPQSWGSNQLPPPPQLGPNDLLIAEFTVSRDSNSSLEKIKIVADQTYQYFLFHPEASKHDTHIRVVLSEKVKLQYHCTYSFEDTQQRSIRTVQLTQSYQVPFEVTPSQVEVNGNEIKVMIPNRF